MLPLAWKIRRGVETVMALFLLAMVALTFADVWLFVKHGLNASRISEVSQALRVPRGPLYFFMALSCALSALAALIVAVTGPMIDPKDTHEEDAL